MLLSAYVTWNRKRVPGSGSVTKHGSDFLKIFRKRVRVGSVFHIYVYTIKHHNKIILNIKKFHTENLVNYAYMITRK